MEDVSGNKIFDTNFRGLNKHKLNSLKLLELDFIGISFDFYEFELISNFNGQKLFEIQNITNVLKS